MENATDFEGALRERLVYEAVKVRRKGGLQTCPHRGRQTRYSKAFSEYDHRGELAEHQAAIFTFILRLRQLCLHPLLWAFGRLRHMRDPDDKEKFLLQSPKCVCGALVLSELTRAQATGGGGRDAALPAPCGLSAQRRPRRPRRPREPGGAALAGRADWRHAGELNLRIWPPPT